MLARFDSYKVFLASLVTLQNRADDIFPNPRQAKYRNVVAELHKVINIIKENDGWDGRSPSLDELLSEGSEKQ
jgi:hypothetical protein